jgi:putative DNA primase/helicase
MMKQALIERITNNFPPELRSLNQWVVWKLIQRPGEKKPTKVPYATDGAKAESDNPATWASFDAASAAFMAGDYNGLGYMFSEFDPYAGVDFDGCVAGEHVDPKVNLWLHNLDSYSEFSQSGTGIHTIIAGKLPGGGRKSTKHGVEMYDNRRFFVVTGDHVAGTPTAVNGRQAELTALHNEVFPAKDQMPPPTQSQPAAIALPDDEALLQRMFAARNGTDIEALWRGDLSAYGNDESAADLALCNHLAFYTGRDSERIDRLFRQSGLYREKWNRNARTGETYGAGTIARAIAVTSTIYTGQRINGSTNGAHYTNGAAHHKTEQKSDGTETVTDEQLREPAPQAKKNFDPLRYRAEDGGILDAWLDVCGNKWLFSVGHDLWHYWNNTHWQEDKERLVFEQILDLMDTMNRECTLVMKETPGKIKALVERYAKVDMDTPESAIKDIERMKLSAEIAKSLHKATKRSSGRVASVEIMARSKRRAETPKFNAMESMNLKNGTLDLRSLELLPHNPEDLFSYCLDYEYDPNADCSLFKKFVSDVLVHEGTTDTDEKLVSLFQELLGYSLTTQTNYQVMVWMPGEGSNGKSVAISILKALLGPLATSIDFQTLGTAGNYDMAEIPGKRVLLSLESEKGGGIAEKHIKAIVSGDLMKTRPIYGSPIDFCSTAKIWWAMNDKPVIKDTTNAIWRRMKMIPFHRTFDESTADPYLLEKLLHELPGILNWAIEGLIRLNLNSRFTTAENAENAKQVYKDQSNPVSQWMNTMCVPTSYPTTLQGALYTSFKNWCIDNGERLITSTQFTLDLKRLKVESKRKTSGVMYYLALIGKVEREKTE